MKTARKIEPPFVRNQFNYDPNEIGDQSGLDTGTEGGAKQSFKDEVDINTIVKRFGIGYEMPTPTFLPGTQDFTNIPDFHTAMNLRAKAFEQFEQYPANVRAKFDNDPEKWVDFTLNPENREEIKRMGFLSPEALQRDQEAADKALRAKEASDKADAIKRAKRENSASGGSRRENTPDESE